MSHYRLRLFRYCLAILLAPILLLLSACEGRLGGSGKLSIVTTIAPSASLIEEIGGGHVSVTTLLPKGNSPENYEPTPRDILALSQSRGYFYIGDLGFERSWIDRIRSLQPELSLIRLDTSLQQGDHGHDHDGLVHDPHYWTSLRGLRAMSQTILAGLSSLDTLHRAHYEQGYAEVIDQIDRLEHVIRETLQTLPSRSFVIYHPSLTDFADEWGLEQLVIEEDGKEPSPAHLERIIRRAKEAGVRVVFVQKEFESKIVRSIASELGAETCEINPLSGGWLAELMAIATVLAHPEQSSSFSQETR